MSSLEFGRPFPGKVEIDAFESYVALRDLFCACNKYSWPTHGTELENLPLLLHTWSFRTLSAEPLVSSLPPRTFCTPHCQVSSVWRSLVPRRLSSPSRFSQDRRSLDTRVARSGSCWNEKKKAHPCPTCSFGRKLNSKLNERRKPLKCESVLHRNKHEVAETILKEDDWKDIKNRCTSLFHKNPKAEKIFCTEDWKRLKGLQYMSIWKVFHSDMWRSIRSILTSWSGNTKLHFLVQKHQRNLVVNRNAFIHVVAENSTRKYSVWAVNLETNSKWCNQAKWTLVFSCKTI